MIRVGLNSPVGRMCPTDHQLISPVLEFSAVTHVKLVTDVKIESQKKTRPMQWIFKCYNHNWVYSTLPRNIKMIAQIKA